MGISYGFRWTTPPDVFVKGVENYGRLIMDVLFDVMVEEAVNVQAFMRANAVWIDNVDPSRSYLRAIPFRNDRNMTVGIIAFYDVSIYIQKGGKSGDFGIAHETKTFPKAGVISIILPRRTPTVLGDEAPRIWDRVRALFA